MTRWGEIKCPRCEELEKACVEWAEVSQSNYQRAKAAEAKLATAMEQCAQIAESHKPSSALLADRYWRGVDEAAHSIAVEIYATLEELKGQDDE